MLLAGWRGSEGHMARSGLMLSWWETMGCWRGGGAQQSNVPWPSSLKHRLIKPSKQACSGSRSLIVVIGVNKVLLHTDHKYCFMEAGKLSWVKYGRGWRGRW